MDKQYTIGEIEEMLDANLPSLFADVRSAILEHGTRDFIVNAPAIIRQLLARVKEADAVEEMLKGYALDNSTEGRFGETIYYDENKSQWCVQGFTDSHHNRLYLALRAAEEQKK